MSDFTHFNEQGRAKMVDVGEKPISQRVAVAAGRVLVNERNQHPIFCNQVYRYSQGCL